MLDKVRSSRPARLLIAFGIGIVFGFLLQRAGVAEFDVVIGQLLLRDFTVVKVMLTAVMVGMLGVYLMRDLGMVTLHPKPGSFGTSVLGGLVFGLGFAILGYCPGTVMAAAGQGNLDALLAGIPGILIGAALFAAAYPRLERNVLKRGDFGDVTIPQLLRVNHWLVIGPVCVGIIILLSLLP